MISILVWLVLAAVAALAIYVVTRPDSFRIERSITVQCAPEKVYELINNFHHWEAWSPWEKVDPNITRTYSGATQGPGAVYAWSGNKNIGQGRMEIKESTPPSRITIQLDFLAPFEAHNTAEFVITPQGNATHVSHAMFGPSPLMSKIMGLFFNMDKMVGSKFEEGLNNLKQLAER